MAVEALRDRDIVQAIAARYEVHPNEVSAWKRQAVEGLEEVFSRPGSKGGEEQGATIRHLHAKMGELTVAWRRRSSAVIAAIAPRGAVAAPAC